MNNSDKKTCGELHLETVRESCKSDAERMAFAVGMFYGQAEKVYNGCCPAAMFRVGPENFAAYLEAIQPIVIRLGLQQRVINYSWPSKPGDECFPAEHTAREIWIYKPNFRRKFGRWLEYPPNSVLWHCHRADDCGIPNSEYDPFYHERKAFNKVADELLNTRKGDDAKGGDEKREASETGRQPIRAAERGRIAEPDPAV